MPRRRTALLSGRAGVQKITVRGRPAFYRITGYRDSEGRWVSRDPRNGHWYYQRNGRHKAKAPTAGELRASEHINVEIAVEGEAEVKYISVPGDRLL